MQELFSLEDIFNVMMELETLGFDHYTKMVELTDDYKLKELFSLLATQEKAHKEIYAKYKTMEITFDHSKIDSEYKGYMTSLLAGTVRFLTLSNTIKDFDHGFDIAVNLEKDTLIFLGEIRGIIDESYHVVLDNIIDQERNHLKALYTYQTSH